MLLTRFLFPSFSHISAGASQLGKQKCNNINLIDIDNDGDLDAFTDNDGGKCKLWINQGGQQNGKYGIFEDSKLELPSGTGILYDLNSDGKQDALIANKIWINEYGATYVNDIKRPQVHIFPNPTSQTIQIKGIDMPLNKANYQLTNINGKIIKQGKLNAETIDISGLQKGIYMLTLHTSESIITKKIVVE